MKSKSPFFRVTASIIPTKKREKYVEIYLAEAIELQNNNLFSRLVSGINFFKMALILRWYSWAQHFRSLVSVCFLAIGLFLITIFDSHSVNLCLAVYFWVASWVTDIRKVRIRFALEVTSGYFFVSWFLVTALVALSKLFIDTTTPVDEVGKATYLVFGFSGLMVTVYLWSVFSWLRAVREFENHRLLIVLAISAFAISMAFRAGSFMFVQFSWAIPESLIQQFHATVKTVNDISALTLWITCGLVVIYQAVVKEKLEV